MGESGAGKVRQEADRLTGDVKVAEATLEGAEEDKMTKDNQIRTLKEEIAHQEELIAKLQKEKRSIGDTRQKTEEDIQAMEDKCNHLNKVKGKLEQALDEVEDALEREKKTKGDVEKSKRKIEGDLKLTQEAVSDLERVKGEIVQTIQRKDKEITSLSAKIDDEATLGSKYHKQVKELQSRLEEVDEELVMERTTRAKAGNNTATQIELNKKREAELAKLKAELDESNISHEGTLAALRQKHNNNMAEMGEQIDGLNKMKAKAEKDKAGMERDLQEARTGLDEAMRDRANHERNGKLTQALIVESNVKLDDMARALNEADSSKKKLSVENQDLTRQIDEVESSIAALSKNKISLSTQLEDTKRLGDSEARDRAALLAKYKNLSTELENLKERIQEESQKKSDALKALSKSNAEIQLWKSKMETEAAGRIDELEMGKTKLNSALSEADSSS